MEKQVTSTIMNFIELSMEKIAATLKENLSPDIKTYIKELKSDPERIFVLATPMGASEYYGANNNGDYFSEESLNPKDPNATWGYRSFEQTPARIYIKHNNKDPNTAIGQVVKSAYNEDMHRVEVIMALERSKAPEIVNAIEGTEKEAGASTRVDISMGCKLIDGDVCSVCKHRSVSKLEYCPCLREKIGQILPDGRKVYAENPKPVFFDLSIVTNPAAKEAAILRKVAHDLATQQITMPEIRQYYAQENPRIDRVRQLLSRLVLTEPTFDLPTLNKMAETDLSFKTMIDTLYSLGIVLKPEEFQYVSLCKSGMSKLAEQYHTHKVIFTGSSLSTPIPDDPNISFSDAFALMMRPNIKPRSIFSPFLSERMLQLPEKLAVDQSKKVLDSPLLFEVSKLYNGYREYGFNFLQEDNLSRVVKEHEMLVPLWLETDNPMVKIATFEQYSTIEGITGSMVSPVTYLYIILS